jgi:hypothetical protein
MMGKVYSTICFEGINNRQTCRILMMTASRYMKSEERKSEVGHHHHLIHYTLDTQCSFKESYPYNR